MKNFITIFILFLLSTSCYANSLDKALNSSSKAMDAGIIYGGVGTAAGVANTISNMQVNASIKRRLDTETNLIKKQAALQGIDLRDGTDIQKEHMALYFQSRYFLKRAKRQAKDENDKEMLKLIRKYWKPWTTTDTIYAAEKVLELREKREREKNKL